MKRGFECREAVCGVAEKRNNNVKNRRERRGEGSLRVGSSILILLTASTCSSWDNQKPFQLHCPFLSLLCGAPVLSLMGLHGLYDDCHDDSTIISYWTQK